MIKFKTHEEYLDWLDEFAEYGCSGQPEEKPVAHCFDCDAPIYEGDTAFVYNRVYYCEECIEKGRTIAKRLESI